MTEVRVYLSEARTVEQKRDLTEALSLALARGAGADPEAVTIHFVENSNGNQSESPNRESQINV